MPLLNAEQLASHRVFQALLDNLRLDDLPDLTVSTGEHAEAWKTNKSIHGALRNTFTRQAGEPADNEELSVRPPTYLELRPASCPPPLPSVSITLQLDGDVLSSSSSPSCCARTTSCARARSPCVLCSALPPSSRNAPA